ncbi:MAG: choice-of-anchor Q domain-containing protein [Gemmataceae bacterium]
MSFGHSFRRLFGKRAIRPRLNRGIRFGYTRLTLNELEDRRVPATITVTGNGDDVVVGGGCTLREAIQSIMGTTDANGDVTSNKTGSYGTNDSIIFNGAMTISVGATLGQLTISKPISISGLGQNLTVIQNAKTAAADARIFDLSATGNAVIKMNDMTLSNGNLIAGAGNLGGAIRNADEFLELTNVTFSNNTAVGQSTGATGGSAAGGAIAMTVAGGKLTLTGCTFTNNLASGTVSGSSGSGGAVVVIAASTVTVNSCSFLSNTAGVSGGALQFTATSNCSITNSTFTSNSASTSGGGVLNMTGASSTVSISSTTFTTNSASGSTGGAVNLTGASTTASFTACNWSANVSSSNGGAFQGSGNTAIYNFTSCTVTTNQSAGASGGGGLRFQGTSPTVTIDSCTLSGNTANGSGSAGAISNTGGTSPVMNISNTLISGNVAAGTSGGGLDITAASTTITNSTISGNSVVGAAGNGGGLTITTGALTVYNSTIYGNTAGTGTGAGGGIRKSQINGTGAVTLYSTIVAGNVASTAADISSSATTVTINIGGGRNLIGVANAGNFTLSGINKTGVDTSPLDAKLNSLGSNGGPTLTHSLQTKSPAFNAGSNVLVLPFDQRGTGFSRVNGSNADVGAFEGVSPDPGAKVTLPNVPPINASYQAIVVYADETGIDTTTIDVNDVVLSGPVHVGNLSPTTVTFTGPVTSVTATYTFTPPGSSWDYSDDGVYTLTMQPNQVLDTDGPNPVASGGLGSFSVTIALPNPFVVDNSGDTDDGDVGPTKLTLREAIRLSNATPGQLDSITFDSSLNGKTITMGSQITITDALSITGLGAANLKLSGGSLSRILNVNLTTGTDTVTISQIKFSDGNGTDGPGGAITESSGNLTLNTVTFDFNQSSVGSGAAGGAISFGAVARLTLNNCTLTNNSAAGSSTSSTGGGGAISTSGAATVTLNNCLLDSNSSTFDGGGAIHGQTTLTVNVNDSTITNNNSGGFGGAMFLNTTGSSVASARSTVSGNTATGGGSSAGGGGGFYFNSTGTFTADNSTFASNTAKSGGVLSFKAGTVTFTQCTLSGNSSSDNGGAISMNANASTITMNNSTVYGNSANNVGGGIRKNFTGTNFVITLNSTIVAGNTASGSSGTTTNFGADIDCSGTSAVVIAGGNNLVGVSDAGNFTLSGSNQTGTKASPLDPLLSALAANGGTTLTQALKAGSPAFNKGANPLSLTTDQRGTGFARTLQGTIDIGAFEGVNPVPNYSGTLANVPPINATYKASVTYTSSVGINTGSIDVNDVRLSGPGYITPAAPISPPVIIGNNGDQTVTVEYEFSPPGTAWDYTDDGTYQLSVQDNQVYDTSSPTPLAAIGGQVNTMLVSIPLPVLVVDNIDDVDDGDYSAGKFTLREAINRANAAISTTETITFAPALNGQTILALSPLSITDPVQITGPGSTKLTISGGGFSTIFTTQIAPAGSAVSISGLTISGGSASTGSAITINSENVSLTDCVIRNNANFGNGGAVNVVGSTATLTATGCTFDNNFSGAGGAITVQNNAGLFVNNSLFTDNSTNTGFAGGAIRFVGSTTNPVNVAIRNSTFVGNATRFTGGAIGFNLVFSGTALVQNCTITGNFCDSDNNADGEGGGIALYSGIPNGKLVIDSCIVWGNFKGTAAPVASDVSNGSTSQMDANFSLIGEASAAGNFVPDAKTTSLLGQDPLLNALGSNGGPTQTMSIQAASPAKNNGSNPAGLTTDQRGAGYSRTALGATDIGAYEIQAPPTVTSVVLDEGTGNTNIGSVNGAIQRSQVRRIIVTFSEAVNFMGDVTAAFTVHRTGTAGTVGDVALTANPAIGSASSVTITFGGPLTESNGSLVDGLYDFIIGAAQVSGAGGALDGNNDTIPGGDYTVTGTTANKWFRFYGDQNGDAAVDQNDYLVFRNALSGGPNTVFDFNNDGDVDQNDYLRFRQNISGAP